VLVPHVPRTRIEKTSFQGRYRQQIPLQREKFEGVLPGMVGAAEYGTARRGVDARLGIAGKTGSCIGKGSWLGLFASVAPVEKPKYAVVVITRGQGERGKYAAAVAGKVYEALKPRLFEEGVRNIALIPDRLKPKSMIEPATTTAAADTDEEDEDETAGSAVPQPQAAPVPVFKKKVTTIVDQKPVNPPPPLFKPVIITVKKKQD
jgi:hypothetical protein